MTPARAGGPPICRVRPLLSAAPRRARRTMNLHDYDGWLIPLATAFGAAVVGVLVYVVLRPIARRISRRST